MLKPVKHSHKQSTNVSYCHKCHICIYILILLRLTLFIIVSLHILSKLGMFNKTLYTATSKDNLQSFLNSLNKTDLFKNNRYVF